MLPKVNQHLFIQVMSDDNAEENEEYKSRVADVSADHLFIEIPINVKTGKLKRMQKGDMLSAYFINEAGVKFYFNTFVAGFREEVIRLIAIRKPDPESVSKIQRRGFLRVSAELEISIKLTEQAQFLGITEDIGGGGLSFLCEGTFPLKANDNVSCWLLIQYKKGSVEHVPFKGELVRVKQLETGRQLAMLKFSDITDFNRQKVIRYCFERQLMNKK